MTIIIIFLKMVKILSLSMKVSYCQVMCDTVVMMSKTVSNDSTDIIDKDSRKYIFIKKDKINIITKG